VKKRTSSVVSRRSNESGSRAESQVAYTLETIHEFETAQYSRLRGGGVAPIKQMQRFLNIGAAGEVKPRFQRNRCMTSPAAPWLR
jgi:hypothetical protein